MNGGGRGKGRGDDGGCGVGVCVWGGRGEGLGEGGGGLMMGVVEGWERRESEGGREGGRENSTTGLSRKNNAEGMEIPKRSAIYCSIPTT